tara:strand:- start:197 stop:592 length:396 start_codon:yes stop_codon:yes gene_type:complete
MSEISIIKLMDGSTIVGKLTITNDIVEIEHPIELVSNITPIGSILGEQINLRPWVAIAEEHIFTIDRYNVITVASLQENFIQGYERMVEHIYFGEDKWEESLLEKEGELPTEEDLETISDYAEAILKKQIH